MTQNPRRALVLLADDEPSARILARETLEQGGFEVIDVGDGREALRALGERRPDILLLDVEMPIMDGFSTCVEFRKLPWAAHVPVLITTGLDDLESIARAYEVGATDFVTKPINWFLLRQRVRYMLRASVAVEGLAESEAKNKALLNAIPDAMFQIGADGTLLDFKPGKAFSPLVPPEEFLNRRVHDVLPQRISEQCVHFVEKALQSKEIQEFEYRLMVEDRLQDYEARIVASGSDSTVAIVRDVTEEREASRALKKERDFVSTVLDTASALVVVLDLQGRIIRVNRSCEETTGYTFEEIRDNPVWDLLLPPEEVERERVEFEQLVSGGPPTKRENHWICKDGSRRYIAWSNSAVVDLEGGGKYVVCTGIDHTERKQAEERVHFLAYFDGVTSLPNRFMFKEHLNQALAYSDRYDRLLAVMFLDLNRFKEVNDTLGHSQGDVLLKAVAERLGQTLRRSDSLSRVSPDEPTFALGRFGGDEFIVMVNDIHSPQRAAKVAQRLLRTLQVPFRLDLQEVTVTASMGISMYPHDGANADVLLKNADAAMYHSKKDGTGSNYAFYSSAMTVDSMAKLSLESDLRKAVKQGQLRLHYQPKVAIQNPRIVGFEALVRWEHPTKGLVAPGEFIQLAEETGLILELGEWGLRTACAQSKQWQQAGLKPLPVAVNLSTLQFLRRDLLKTVAKILKETALDPRLLELEITEGTIMQNPEDANRMLLGLKDLGIKLSIDDFGTGYSSLSYLKRFTLDTLKIDRSFVQDLATSKDDRSITRAIIAMGHSLDLRIIAEGVETDEQLAYLREQRCDEIQGFLISPPVAADQIPTLLKNDIHLPASRSEESELALSEA